MIEIKDDEIFVSESFKLMDSDIPTLKNVGSEYIFKYNNIEKLYCFTEFEFEFYNLIMDGDEIMKSENPNRYLKVYYRLSRNGKKWDDWQELKENIDNFPELDPKKPTFMQVKFVREGDSEAGQLRLLDFKLKGIISRNESILGEESFINMRPNEELIIKSPFRMKVYRIDDIEFIPELNDEIDVYYRFTQDSSRTWTEWEPLTMENISTVRINPIRFFEIEYKINSNKRPVSIQDINIIGDFHNITKDVHKTNLFGIRENCKSNEWGYYDEDGKYHPNTNMNANGKGTINDGTGLPEMTDDQKANLYNPYDQNVATDLLEKLSVDAEQMFGHQVTYFSTDADHKGQDHLLNEYQLYNVNCSGDLKVSIAGNEFPDNQIKMNIFDLDLFDTMEAHITKKQFKKIFGEERRPSKEDFIYFCQVNRMYQVDHAQQSRSFNNTAIMYKLILKKYNQKSNVKAGNSLIENELAKLTKNTTIDELFGVERERDIKAVSNKKMIEPLSRDTRRYEYKSDIVKFLLENSTNIISKSFYELNSVNYKDVAVKYNNFLRELKVSDNLSLTMWFHINNYMEDEEYTFMNNYDEDKKVGWKTVLKNDTITTTLNDTDYNIELISFTPNTDPEGLEEKVWYALVLNIDQRQRKLQQFIYKRNVNKETDASKLNSTALKIVYSQTVDINPVDFYIEDITITPSILASDMKITNIRLFSDIIKKSEHNKLLNLYLIGDYKYIIFGDNATRKLELSVIPYNENY